MYKIKIKKLGQNNNYEKMVKLASRIKIEK